MYYHGEEIHVNVHIANSSSKTCKKIKVTSKSCAKRFKNYFRCTTGNIVCAWFLYCYDVGIYPMGKLSNHMFCVESSSSSQGCKLLLLFFFC